MLAFVLDQILRLLHPFMPFITEGIYQNLNDIAPRRGLKGLMEPATPEALMIAPWPVAVEEVLTRPVKSKQGLQQVIRSIRDIRSQYNIAPSKLLTVSASAPQTRANCWPPQARLMIEQLAGLKCTDRWDGP